MLKDAARNRLAELELEYGIEKSKVDSIRSQLFGGLREFYQERDRLRWLVQFHGGAYAPSRVVFCALAENRRLMCGKRVLSYCGPTLPRGRDMAHAGARVLPAAVLEESARLETEAERVAEEASEGGGGFVIQRMIIG